MRAAGILAMIVVLPVMGCGPWERTPGFRLFGDVVREPVEDWSFAEAEATIAVETRPWYGIPHSVTTVCFVHDGALYVPSRNPRGKRWVSSVLRDPRVRLRIAGRIYERRAVRITDDALAEALHEKLRMRFHRPRQEPSERPEMWFFRMDPRE